MIKNNKMVRLKIGADHWVGKVVEIKGQVALIQLLDNMHYHACLDELELLVPEQKINKSKANDERT